MHEFGGSVQLFAHCALFFADFTACDAYVSLVLMHICAVADAVGNLFCVVATP